MARKKILITGANGFLGSNLTEYLSRSGEYEVFAMVRPSGTMNFLHRFEKDSSTGEALFQLVEADLGDEEGVKKAAEGMDAIVHLAGMVTDWGPREKYYELNVEGTERVLRAATAARVSTVLYLSSLTVHAMKGHYYSDETSPADITGFPYGETKRTGEDLVLRWAAEKAGRQGSIVRPGFVIYGAYDKNTFINVLDAIEAGRFGFIDGGKKLISYVYAENLAYGIERLLAGRGGTGIYNILDGNMTWKEWIGTWAEALGVKAPKLSVPYWLMYIPVSLLVGIYRILHIKKAPILTHYRIRIMHRDLAFSNEKAIRELGYNPPVSFGESIKRTLNFYSSR